jgi:hypothetical protein
LDLLTIGIVLFALLMASYSDRRAWIAFGSAAISIALIIGCVFLSAGEVPSPVRQGLARLEQELPPGWDQHARDLVAGVERVSTGFANAKKRAAERAPILAASITHWFASEPKADADPAPSPVGVSSNAPIKWFLDEPPPAASETSFLHAANVSDQPLENIRAVLKPDSGADELALTLDVEGRTAKDGAVVPPGARFSLAAKTLTKDEVKQLGGATLSFGYLQAGRRKTSIMYLTPPMLGERAARD